MTKLKLLIDIMGSGFEAIIIYYYMRAIFRDTKVNRGIEIFTYIIITILLSIVSINYPNTILIPLFSFILILIASILYEGNFFLKIIKSLIVLALFILFEVIAGMAIVALSGRNVEYISNNLIYYLQGVLVSKLLVFIVVKTFEYRRNTNYTLVTQKILIPLVLMPLTSILVIYIVTDKAYFTTDTYEVSLIILTITLLILAIIYFFHLFEKQLMQEEEKIKLEFIKEQLKNQKIHFEELINNQTRINKAIHDTKNQLLAILGYIENNKNEMAIRSLSILCDNIMGEKNFINTGNIAVDSLLNAKVNKINELNIDLETNILLELNINIDEIELCVILGNVLDNAIEACQKIPAKKEKKIRLNIVQVEEHLSIEISNSIYNKVEIVKGRIATTKREKIFHGYGLENVKDVVERYNGHINFEQEEDIFTVRILLQNVIFSPVLHK